LCRTHYMFRPIWPSSGVNIYIKIALKTAALFHLCFPASRFQSIVHRYVRCFLLLFLSCLCCVPLLWVIIDFLIIGRAWRVDASWTLQCTVIPRVTALRTYRHFEMPLFPEVAALVSELRLFGGMALPPDRLPTTGVAVFSLQTRFALHFFFFALLCYTLWRKRLALGGSTYGVGTCGLLNESKFCRKKSFYF
jgi:hypothetical protein